MNVIRIQNKNLLKNHNVCNREVVKYENAPLKKQSAAFSIHDFNFSLTVSIYILAQIILKKITVCSKFFYLDITLLKLYIL